MQASDPIVQESIPESLYITTPGRSRRAQRSCVKSCSLKEGFDKGREAEAALDSLAPDLQEVLSGREEAR